ncbi:tetratricopeptide repeat protein [Aquipluma nitroreducens]|uniref:tetratricopeptide repeat protein n=1 Tax=Aquipluma nitroreducens TaxID=2010828 RepID=UPI00296FCF4A|nr:tetratricopeptide repeat protein [Aquipluma nitroreducens]
MKRTTILFVLLFAVSCAFAQKGKVTSALSYKESGKLDKAVEAIEETIDASNPKTESSVTWPRTWEVRGEIYQAVFQSKDENYKKLSADPLTVAYDSYMKALQLDDKDRFSKSVKIKLTLLIGDLTNQAVAAFNEETYEKAMKSFEQIMAIEQLPVYKADDPNAVDTVIIFNAGLAAYNAQKYDKAIEYYKEAAKYKYNGAKTYSLIANSYFQKKDTVGALQVLQDGLKEYSDNGILLVEVINVYLNANKIDAAMKYLDIAIAQDPKNASYFFAQGTLYDKLQKPEEAAASYLKAIEYKEDYFDAYYNLGALYYNKGVKQVDVANLVPSNQPEKYEVEKDKADVEFKKAIPYMEKAHEINPTDKFTLESLKTLYYRLKMLDKHAEIIEKMKSIQ